MKTALLVLQLFVSLNILRIWLITNNRASVHRGGDGKAKTLKEEFEVYGLPVWFMYVVGALKISAAIGILAGIWMPQLLPYASAALMLLMTGAIIMHIKVNDKLHTYLPALLMFSLSAIIFYLWMQLY